MTEPSPISKPFPKAELSATTKLKALELKARIQSGEKIPLSEIQAFVVNADFDLDTTRIKTATKEKLSDVDFF